MLESFQEELGLKILLHRPPYSFQLNFLAFEKNIKFCVQIQTTTSIFRDVQDWTPLQPGAVCIGTVLHVLQVHEKKVLIIKELIFEFPVDCLIVNSISINFFEH